MIHMLANTRVWRADETSPVKRYLMEYHALSQRRDALLQELERLREATLRTTGCLTAVRLSGKADPRGPEDALLRVIDGEARLQAVIDHIGEALGVRLTLIERLPDERQKTLLTLRYINGWNWERIGYEMHYERTQIFEIHTQALLETQKLMFGAESSQLPQDSL
jgi:hypothetical protein